MIYENTYILNEKILLSKSCFYLWVKLISFLPWDGIDSHSTSSFSLGYIYENPAQGVGGCSPPPGDKLSRRGIYGLLVEYKSNSCIPKIDYKFYCKKVFWFSSSWVELNLNHNDWNSLNYVHLKNEKQLYLPHCQSDSGLQLKGNCCLL